MKQISLFCLFVIMLTSCDFNSCFQEDYIVNTSEVDILLLPTDPNLYNKRPWYTRDTIRIKANRSFQLCQVRSGQDFQKSVTEFVVHDSVYVIFVNAGTVTHYNDILRGDYERSIFNIDAYVKEGCTYTYTFTQQDYEAAKAGI